MPGPMDDVEARFKEHGRKLRKNTLAFRREVVDKMSSLATAAFGLVAALAWNTAIQEAFKRIPWTGGSGVWALVGYAAFVTIVAVLVIIWIGRFAGRLKDEHEAELDAKAAAAPAP